MGNHDAESLSIAAAFDHVASPIVLLPVANHDAGSLGDDKADVSVIHFTVPSHHFLSNDISKHKYGGLHGPV